MVGGFCWLVCLSASVLYFLIERVLAYNFLIVNVFDPQIKN